MKYITFETIKENKILGPMFRHIDKLESPFAVPEHDYEALADILISASFQNLNFRDPQLVSKLYAVVLESKRPISENILVTGLMLTWANQSFYDENIKQYPGLKKYEFDQKRGPYQIGEIFYLTPKQRHRFKRKNKKIKDGGYYSINLPRKWSSALLYDIIEYDLILPVRKKLISFLKAYYVSRQSSQDNSILPKRQFFLLQKKWVSKNPPYTSKKFQSLVQNFKKLIEFREPDLVEFLQMNDASEVENPAIKTQRESVKFLCDLININDLIPPIKLSPDYDQSNPESPLLCMINFTISSAIQLQKTLFGKQSSSPLFLVGALSSTLFLQTLCHPQTFGKSECRPAELAFPGLARADNYHGFQVNAYLVLWHDCLLHGFRNGANPFKPLVCYMINFLQNLKGFAMSSWIEYLCDMDINMELLGCISRRNNLSNSANLLMIGISLIFFLLREYNGESITDVLGNSEKMDTMLAMIFDMHKNSKKWQPLLGGWLPTEIFKDNSPSLPLLCENYQGFLHVFNKMKVIVDAYPHESVEYCILAYRLQAHLMCWPIVEVYLRQSNLKNILKWSQNNGIYFYSIDTNIKYELEDLHNEPLDICLALWPLLIAHQLSLNPVVRSDTVHTPAFSSFQLKSRFTFFSPLSGLPSNELKENTKLQIRSYL